MSYHKWIKNLFALSIAMVMLALLFFTFGQRPTTQAQGETAYVRLVRVLEDNELLPGDDKLIEVLEKPAGDLDPNIVAGMDLEQLGIKDPQGLTLDPTSGHLHAFSLANQKLYELNQAGQVVVVRDLSQFGLTSPQSMVFAPSGDQTDDPAKMNLYLTDGEQIYEMSFTPIVVPAAPADFTSGLVQSFHTNPTNTNWITYSSPDPAGVIYLPSSDSLLFTDSEINELKVPTNAVEFMGVNVFESSLTGTLVSTETTWMTQTMTFSNEPTGIGRNPTNGNLFISDDQGPGVGIYEINLGANGKYDFSDWPGDHTPTFRTILFGSQDPEGVTYATKPGPGEPGTLFIADDTNNEIYQVAPGPNGVFDGVPPAGDDVVASFDTEFIVDSPEGIAYNPDIGHLYVIGNPSDIMFEFTFRGALYQTIDISEPDPSNPSGLAYAPSSVSPGVMNIYIAARGADSDQSGQALQNDGMAHEMTLPPITNVPPIAVDDGETTPEDTPRTIDVATNDTDSDSNLDPSSALTDISVCPSCSDPISGTLHNNGDGTFVYTPTLNFNGSDSFVYEICDAEGACDTAKVIINVTPVDDPPTPVGDTKSTDEDTPVTIDVAANDTDPENNLDANSANSTCANGSTGCLGAAHGLLGDNFDGTITYTPTLNFNGIDNFVYEICDDGGLCSTGTVTVTVNPIDDPPVAVDDTDSTSLNTKKTVDVAANDFDPDGNLDKLSTNVTCTGCSDPTDGVLDNNGDGTFDYTPDLNFTGVDNFVYEICDTGALCDTATVTITVINDPPVAVNDSANTTINTLVTIDVAANDFDPDGNLDKLSTNATCTGCILPVNGTLDNNGDGTFDYTPKLDFIGGDSFVYEICDTLDACDTAEVNIAVTKHMVFIPAIIRN